MKLRTDQYNDLLPLHCTSHIRTHTGVSETVLKNKLSKEYCDLTTRTQKTATDSVTRTNSMSKQCYEYGDDRRVIVVAAVTITILTCNPRSARRSRHTDNNRIVIVMIFVPAMAVTTLYVYKIRVCTRHRTYIKWTRAGHIKGSFGACAVWATAQKRFGSAVVAAFRPLPAPFWSRFFPLVHDGA